MRGKYTDIVKAILAAAVLMLGCIGNNGVAFATPSINDVTATTGTINDGQIITITGTGFGSGPNILFFDDFEGGTVGQNIKTGVGSAPIGAWTSLNTVPPKYSSTTSVSGTKAFSVTAVPGVEGQTNANITLPNVTETFLSWWCYVPSSSPWPGEGAGSIPPNNINWKNMWMMQSGTTDNDADYAMIAAPYNWYISGNNTPYQVNFSTSALVKGSWHRYWWWQKDGYNNDGTVRLWELRSTGVYQIVNSSNVSTMFSGAVRKRLSVNGYTREHDSGTMPTQMFDDIYIATGPNSQARVEIGTGCAGGVYTTCTNLAVSTSTAWDGVSPTNTITATVRGGSITSGQAYLFVIDGNGNASVGKSISFGKAGTMTPPHGATGSGHL